MAPPVVAACFSVVLAGAVLGAGPLPRRPRRWPVATSCALLVVGTTSLLQLTVAPQLLGALQRRPDELTGGGPWRLVTSLTVQDGGWPGTVFNLVVLAVVGVVAESLWGRARWWLVALAAGVGAQFWGLVVQPYGAGNSVLVFGLAASLHVLALRYGDARSRLVAGAGLAAGAVLLAGRDVHGGAVVIGAVVATALLWSRGRSS